MSKPQSARKKSPAGVRLATLLLVVLGLVGTTGVVVDEHLLVPPDESPAAAPLLQPAALRHLAAEPGAPGPGGDPNRKTLVLYETDHPQAWLSHEYALQAANLASRGGAWTMQPVKQYVAGALRGYQAAIYVGVDEGASLPPALLADVATSDVPVLWMGENVDQLFAAQPAVSQQYGWSLRGADTVPVPTVEYQGQQLQRDPPDSRELHRVDLVPGGAAVTLGTARPASGAPYPWAVKSKNLTYISEVALGDFNPRGRYLAAADLILRTVAPDAPERKRALIRIEDVGPNTDPDHIRRIADLLSERGVPFSLATYPYYRDPKGTAHSRHKGRPTSFRLVDQPELVDALKYARERGGTVIMHGYSHQFESLDNPYDGTSGGDYEFYAAHVDSRDNVQLDGPVPGDSKDWATDRLSVGRGEFVRVGLPDPDIFEFPHYAASGVNYQAVHDMFGVRYDQGTYYAGQCPDGACSTTADPGSAGRFSQFFPYPVRDVYGSVVIPENVGNISVPYNNRPPKSAEDVIGNAKALSVVRDSVASGFFHPYLPTRELDAIVTGIQQQGYQFVTPYDILKP